MEPSERIVTLKLLLSDEKNCGTSWKNTVAWSGSLRKLTKPPWFGLRSSHSGAILGWSLRNSKALSEKSVSPEPKVRLPFELIKTLVYVVPWNGNSNCSGTSCESSSPRLNNSPGGEDVHDVTTLGPEPADAVEVEVRPGADCENILAIGRKLEVLDPREATDLTATVVVQRQQLT